MNNIFKEKEITNDKSYMLDDFCKTGKSIEEFEKEVMIIDKNTTIDEIDVSESKIFSYFATKESKFLFKILDMSNLWTITNEGIYALTHNISIDAIKMIKECGKELVNELCNKTLTIIYFDENTESGKAMYMLGDTVYKSLSTRSILGGSFLRIPSLERNIALAKSFEYSYDPMFVLSRNIGKYKKIFAIFSSKYLRLSPLVFVEEAKKIGKFDCKNWIITQKKSIFHIEYPEKIKELQSKYKMMDFIPGLLFTVSDTAHAATSVKVVWRRTNCENSKEYFITDEIKIKENEKKSKGIESIISYAFEKMEKRYSDFENKKIGKFSTKQAYNEFCQKTTGDLNIVEIAGKKIQVKLLEYMKNNLDKKKIYMQNDFRDMILQFLYDEQDYDSSSYLEEKIHEINIF